MEENQHSDTQISQECSESEMAEEKGDYNPHAPKLTLQREENDKSCATYSFEHEDHTLGNLLRWAISKDPEVELVGYTIPHPSEALMNLRLQTYGKDTQVVFQRALTNLDSILKAMRSKVQVM